MSYWADALAAHPDPTRVMRVGSALVPVHELPAGALTGALCEEWYGCPATGEGDVFTAAEAVILYATVGESLVTQCVCSGCLPAALAALVARPPRGVPHATHVRVLRGAAPHVATS